MKLANMLEFETVAGNKVVIDAAAITAVESRETETIVYTELRAFVVNACFEDVLTKLIRTSLK